MCSTPNSTDSVFCNNCGARVVPLLAGEDRVPPPIKGLSLPVKPVTPPAEIAPAPRAEESQDWLANLRAAAPVQDTPESLDELPDWLREANAPADADARSQETQSAPAEQVPEDDSWMRELRQKAAVEPVTPAVEETEADEPSWIRDARRAATAESPSEPARADASPEMDWIAHARDVTATPATPAGETENDPAWLENLRPTRAEIVTRGEIAGDAEGAFNDEIPDWLSDAERARAIPETRDFLTPRAGETPAEETPEWLRMAMPSASPPLEPAAASEIPAWVAQLKPLPATPPSAGEPVEMSGPLAGLRGILPLAHALAQVHPRVALRARSNGATGAQVFESILAAPAAAELPRSIPRRVALTLRPVIFILLLLAVTIPFFLPANFASANLRISGTLAAEFFDTVQTLPANSTVLLAFEYDASVAGEMDLLAHAITRQLMQRRVKIVAISTLEAGAPIAQRVLQSAAAASNYRVGVDYVNAGFLAGQEAGVAQFAASGWGANAVDFERRALRQLPLTANLKSARDFALVIEFAGSDDALKLWMEQAQARANLRVAAATSAAAEPKARAYKDAKQLIALVSGLTGAAQYEVLSNQPGQAIVRLNAQSAAMMALVLIVVLGNVAYVIARVRGKA